VYGQYIAFAIPAYVFANRLGWKPLVINNAVSGASNIMLLASEGGKNKLVEGTITTTVLKDPTGPRWNKDAGMKQYRALLAKYAKGANPNDVYHVYGMAVGYETVPLFRRLGANPTRTALMARARSISSAKEPVPPPGRRREDGQGGHLPDPAGPAAAVGEGPLRGRRRALDVEAELERRPNASSAALSGRYFRPPQLAVLRSGFLSTSPFANTWWWYTWTTAVWPSA
jgi:hypothetical protein